ncbi:hypothetical protein DTO013E5_8099 [Penicillium roqueforti]|uniref:uncharacterized protein n=1 Tax=Penicillium roqueforti TaxID=5082 RepID=UPI00190E5B8E|nr:uncharacterized protein LCP9604111_4660 [Penicillium roqueforti]KAF9248944.1 hypothetical protein LCP9604111_4660 [Penicillium roqueforti]KAI1831855.1 hypothetical protein CBS147337_7301 [Penicillium roqueforti]KAI2670080.1 hypothetical protein CBS147355_9493 [Penicillium roqueforti]KAI2677666.1 hypothetical protein LCP963914a_7958 [Penicillium roqueforti]KAI2700243.1 hypothetical protein CBS147372_5860 [Penicillium roqueforti]
MSTQSLPITPGAFAEAIKELPLAVLYSKVSEITNSIAHLKRSNAEIRAYIAESNDSEEDKKDLECHATENEAVMVSMNERIMLLKTEVENRWGPSVTNSHCHQSASGTRFYYLRALYCICVVHSSQCIRCDA